MKKVIDIKCPFLRRVVLIATALPLTVCIIGAAIYDAGVEFTGVYKETWKGRR